MASETSSREISGLISSHAALSEDPPKKKKARKSGRLWSSSLPKPPSHWFESPFKESTPSFLGFSFSKKHPSPKKTSSSSENYSSSPASSSSPVVSYPSLPPIDSSTSCPESEQAIFVPMNNYALVLPTKVYNVTNAGGKYMCDDGFFREISSKIFLMVFNDGNGWGMRSRNAATCTNRIVDEYLNLTLKEKTDFTEVHKNIFQLHKNAILQAHDYLVAHADDSEQAHQTGSTCVIIATVIENMLYTTSVGDCKVFVINKLLSTIKEPTADNRKGVDPRDPGGRIGLNPETKDKPDFRNYLTRVTPLEAGDYVIVCSDGVHDNLTPKYLGMTPGDLSLEGEDWNDSHIEAISKFMSQKLLEILGACQTVTLTPENVSKTICEYLETMTRPRKEWLIKNSQTKEPPVSPEIPGKLDHAGFIVYRHLEAPQTEACSSNDT